MKITVDINGKPTEIELTEEQVTSIEAQSKPKKFEWNYPYAIHFFVATDHVNSGWLGGGKHHLEYGRYRLSREVAKQSLLRNKRANRLEALAEQLGGLKEFVEGEFNHYIYQDSSSLWHPSGVTDNFYPEVVYMTEECAQEICSMLNEGEFSLDGEL